MTEFQHPLIFTNPKPTDPRIERMAMAGFARYYANRPYYTWANAVGPVRYRWQMIAGEVLAGEIDTPRGLRDRYQEGIYGAPAWTPQWVLLWQSVLSAMRIAATAEAAA